MGGAVMELVRKLDTWKGEAELYRHGDRYFVVSTVIVDYGGDFFLGMSNLIAGIGSEAGLLDYPVAEEGEQETQAVWTDAQGRASESWDIIAVTVGEDSRVRMMEKLNAEIDKLVGKEKSNDE